MNWTMGRYIRELDAEGRDRLIAAPDYSDGCWWDGSCGCLVGTAENMGPMWDECGNIREAFQEIFNGIDRQHHSGIIGAVTRGGTEWRHSTAAYRYPCAVNRFGKARVVRAIKLRAARLNGSDARAVSELIRSTAAVREEVAGD